MNPNLVNEFRTRLLSQALAVYVGKTNDPEYAKLVAHHLVDLTIDKCVELGVLERTGPSPQVAREEARAPQGISGGYASPIIHGSAPGHVVPPGTPYAPARHYNVLPDPVGGQQIHPPAGVGYEPPLQAGVMTAVTQVRTPASPSALGTSAIISQPVQYPSMPEQVIAPANQVMIPQVGGAAAMFVPEKIVK
jgi:hypothetical protein